jgi:type IV secretion system protein VirB1
MEMPVDVHHIEQCVPCAPTSIIEAIIRTESGFNPLAMNVNRGFKLVRQPATRNEAEDWARWLLANGYNFDAGLMQINSANWKKLGLTPETVFDLCENIRAGAKLFSESYSRAAASFGPGRDSLVSALSAYNTGDFTSGVHNGYVSTVVQNARIGGRDMQKIPPLILSSKNSRRSTPPKRNKSTETQRTSDETDPFTAPTSVDGFTFEDHKSWDFEPEPESTPGSKEPHAPDPHAPQVSGWRKEISVQTKRLIVTVCLTAILLKPV